MAKKQNGIARRPVEYILYVVIVIMVLYLAWANGIIGKTDTAIIRPQATRSNAPDGTVEAVEEALDADTDLEQQTASQLDAETESETASEAAADNIGGVYDETAF